MTTELCVELHTTSRHFDFHIIQKKENKRCLTKFCSSWILISRYEQLPLIPRTSDSEAFIMAPDAQGTLWPLAEMHKALMYLQCKAINQYHTSRQDNKAIICHLWSNKFSRGAEFIGWGEGLNFYPRERNWHPVQHKTTLVFSEI